MEDAAIEMETHDDSKQLLRTLSKERRQRREVKSVQGSSKFETLYGATPGVLRQADEGEVADSRNLQNAQEASNGEEDIRGLYYKDGYHDLIRVQD